MLMEAPIKEVLHQALLAADLDQAAVLLAAGADINARADFGESLLDHVIGAIDDATVRQTVVRFMLDHGADPCILTSSGGGPLFAAVIAQDTDVLRLLLDHGADPNREHDIGDPLYSWAEFDYRYEAYDRNLPDEPTDADKSSEDAWLQFLDRIAVKYGKRRPDYLLLLRERGALSYSEQQRQNTGKS